MPRSDGTPSNPSDIFGRLRRIEIRTSHLVNDLFGGRYLSTFKGRGMEFSDVRAYVPGDDIRSIDWNVTARLGQPFVKRFTEERELTIFVAVDVSGSQAFGTRERFKQELAAELVALLAFSALKNNDKIGLLLFSDRIESFVPPRKSQRHTLRMIRDVLGFEPEGHGTDIAGALQFLNRVQKRRAVVFLVSDFLGDNYERNLAITRRRHDTVAFVVEDPMEEAWPAVGPVLIDDAEEGERLLIERGGNAMRRRFADANRERRNTRNRLLAQNSIDTVHFRTDQDVVRPLLSFFRQRARRLR